MIIFKGVLKGLGLCIALLALVLTFGPRESVDRQAAFAPVVIPDDIDGYLYTKEAQFSDIIEDAQKQVIWANAVGQKTDYSIVYLHGFSATSHEMRPIPEKVANELRANLYYTRFAGHGRSGDAMLDASPEKWLQDAVEAVEIGARLGDEVIVLATSNGGAISTYLLTNPEYSAKITGIVFTAPAYRLGNPLTRILDLPYVRSWGEFVAGKRRGFEGVNEDHTKYWTNEYPSLSVLPMTTLQRDLRKLDVGQIKTPALFFISDEDKVISSPEVRRIAAKWGGSHRLEIRKMTEQDDPYNHVLSGDILNPKQTVETVEIILDWVSGL